MKKIAFVSNSAWNIYNFRLGVMKALQENGFEVLAIAPKDKYRDLILQNGFKFYDVFIQKHGTNPINDVRTILSLYKLFKNLKIDLVFNFSIKPCIYGSIAARMAGVKSISVITGLGYVFINEGFLQTIVKFLYRIALRYNSQIWFQNRDDYKLFKKFNLINIEKSYIVRGSGINTKKFKPVKASAYKKIDNIKEGKKNNKKFKFLLASRILWDKGIGEYVQAARILKKKYPEVSFQLLGPVGVDNPSAIPKPQVQKWVDEGIIEYLGETDEIHKFIANVDCVVLPSYREGTPRILMEAASMEKPIITTNSVGCREVVEDGVNGFLCEVKNVNDLVDKMEKMINLTKRERIQMGKKGRQKMIKEFDERIIIKKYLETLKEFDSL